MRYLLSALIVMTSAAAQAQETTIPPSTPGESKELIRTLHEGANFKPYTDKAAWQKRAGFLREQVLISAGLWPMPEKCPLNAVIHGRIERDGYTIEKVYFQSYPGFYVTGNLYRPTGKPGPFPAVLSPHGHWNNGRLYEAPEKEVANQLKAGLETEADAARYPMQARCANLARLGCIVFFYDMVGYADADPEHFPHRQTYRDIDSDLRGLSVFGLQTWDSIRSLDFLTSLPDVDAKRIAITGASGGASQSIMMMAIDDRLSCAAPVCMISAGEHQGGCVCENNSLLRVGTDNVELSATFAPRPFIHPTASGDWTQHFLEQGFPEIQATYELFGVRGDVESFRQQSGHNYNKKSREGVYNFFNKHLNLGHDGVIEEQKFTPVKPKELSVWDDAHPRPKDAVDAEGLKKWWIAMATQQMEELKPRDAAALEKMQQALRPVLAHVVGVRNENRTMKATTAQSATDVAGISLAKRALLAGGQGRSIHEFLFSTGDSKTAISKVVLVLPGGTKGALNENGTPIELISALVRNGHRVEVPDLFHDEYVAPTDTRKKPVEFFTGYNYSNLARQAQDLVTVLDNDEATDLIGVGDASAVCLLARAIAPDRVRHAVVDASRVERQAADERDAAFLPHALRYGGMWPLVSVGGQGELTLLQCDGAPEWLRATYSAAGAAQMLHAGRGGSTDDIVRALQR